MPLPASQVSVCSGLNLPFLPQLSWQICFFHTLMVKNAAPIPPRRDLCSGCPPSPGIAFPQVCTEKSCLFQLSLTYSSAFFPMRKNSGTHLGLLVLCEGLHPNLEPAFQQLFLVLLLHCRFLKNEIVPIFHPLIVSASRFLRGMN